MTDQNRKTLEDGSIDQTYYAERCRGMRSKAAHALFAGIGGAIASRAARMAGRAAPETRDHREADLGCHAWSVD